MKGKQEKEGRVKREEKGEEGQKKKKTGGEGRRGPQLKFLATSLAIVQYY